MQTSTWAELWHNIEILKPALSHNYKKNLLQATTWAELSQQRATESLVLWALHHLQQVVWPGIFMIRLVFLLKIPFWNIVRFRHSWFRSLCSWALFLQTTVRPAPQKKVKPLKPQNSLPVKGSLPEFSNMFHQACFKEGTGSMSTKRNPTVLPSTSDASGISIKTYNCVLKHATVFQNIQMCFIT